jgi:hypothetical protein
MDDRTVAVRKFTPKASMMHLPGWITLQLTVPARKRYQLACLVRAYDRHRRFSRVLEAMTGIYLIRLFGHIIGFSRRMPKRIAF